MSYGKCRKCGKKDVRLTYPNWFCGPCMDEFIYAWRTQNKRDDAEAESVSTYTRWRREEEEQDERQG